MQHAPTGLVVMVEKYGGELRFEGKDEKTHVEVVDKEHIRTLHFDTPVEQSSMFLNDPFALEMEYIRMMAFTLLFNPEAKKVLCLGLGGGALPKFIWKYFPKVEVTVVEYSELVIEVASRFFEVPQDPRLKICHSEGVTFLQHNAELYDFIFVDLYISTGISPSSTTAHFFELCYKNLSPQGILVWNLWGSSQKELIHVKKVFGSNYFMLSNDERTNSIVTAYKEIPRFDRLAPLAKKLKETSKVDFTKVLKKYVSNNKR